MTSIQLTANATIDAGTEWDAFLGRIGFVTIEDDVKEAIGDKLDVVGSIPVAGERTAKSFSFTIPVHGIDGDPEAYAQGERMRRQVRALLENADARMSGLYFSFRFDAELSCWMLIGGGDLEYAEGGPTFANYKLSLSDAYKVGSLRTHRPARRVEWYDLSSVALPRDTLGKKFTGGQAASTPRGAVVLPPGASDVLVNGRTATVGERRNLDGDMTVVHGVQSGSVVSFKQAETDINVGGVQILDDRARPEPTYSLLGDSRSQSVYGWEEVYGPDQQLTQGRVPIVQNGCCRVRWDYAERAFILDTFVAGEGYKERGKVAVYHGSGSRTQYDTLADVAVRSWTHEGGSISLILTDPSGRRATVYLTLRAGWLGPRIEAYDPGDVGGTLPSIAIRYVPQTSAAATAAVAAPSRDDDRAVHSAIDWPDDTTILSTFTVEGWVLYQQANIAEAVHAAVVDADTWVITVVDSDLYNASRNGFECWHEDAGYTSVHYSFGRPGLLMEAEAMTLGAGVTSGLDVDGTTNVTMCTATSGYIETDPFLTGVNAGMYEVMIRGRVTAGLYPASYELTVDGGTPVVGPSINHTAHTWRHLGKVSLDNAETLRVAWTAPSGGSVRIDKVLLIPVEMTDPANLALDGVRDLLECVALADQRAVAELVVR